jgi:arylsulfatase A-like enzyme
MRAGFKSGASARHLATTCITVFAALVVASCGDPGSGTGQTVAANDIPIVIYLVDTLRADRMGLYGYSARDTSPNLDGIAAESVVFDNAYATAPWTLPSVASIITSTYPCEHLLTGARNKLGPSIQTLAELLSDSGYDTGAYYTSLWPGPGLGLDRGYAVSEQRTYVADQGLTPGFEGSAADWPRDTRVFLDHAGAEPFLLYLHSTEPHDTWQTPTEFITPFGHVGVTARDDIHRHMHEFSSSTWGGDWVKALAGEGKKFPAEKEGDILLKWGQWVATRENDSDELSDNASIASETLMGMSDSVNVLYDASVRYADQNIADVIDILKARGVWDRAIFVFLSDHGEELADHGSWFHSQSVYEELMRVPLLMHFPGGQYGGTRVAAPVSLVDVMPTLLDFIGRPELCAGCRGSSMRRWIENATAPTDADGPLFGVRQDEITYYRPSLEARGRVNVMVRDGRWKGIWNMETETAELYDLDKDPSERDEVSRDHPQQTVKLISGAGDWLQKCRALEGERGEIQDYDEESLEQLRSLGYLE